MQNTNIFLKSKKEDRCGGGRLPAFHRVHRLQVVQGAGPPVVFRGVFRPFALPFVPSAGFACGRLLANMALFRVLGAFLGGFSCSVWVCLAWVLCVACVAFVRVRCLAVLWLVACLPLFLSSLPLFFFFAYLLGLCLCCPLLVLLPALFVLLCLWVLCFLFPFRTIRKKKGRKVFSSRPLLSCYVCLDACIVIKEFRCRCFGFFQFIRFVLPTDAAGVRRLARSYFDFLGRYVNIANNRSAFLK